MRRGWSQCLAKTINMLRSIPLDLFCFPYSPSPESTPSVKQAHNQCLSFCSYSVFFLNLNKGQTFGISSLSPVCLRICWQRLPMWTSVVAWSQEEWRWSNPPHSFQSVTELHLEEKPESIRLPGTFFQPPMIMPSPHQPLTIQCITKWRLPFFPWIFFNQSLSASEKRIWVSDFLPPFDTGMNIVVFDYKYACIAWCIGKEHGLIWFVNLNKFFNYSEHVFLHL